MRKMQMSDLWRYFKSAFLGLTIWQAIVNAIDAFITDWPLEAIFIQFVISLFFLILPALIVAIVTSYGAKK